MKTALRFATLTLTGLPCFLVAVLGEQVEDVLDRDLVLPGLAERLLFWCLGR